MIINPGGKISDNRNKFQKGFTLVELLVAVSLFTILISIVATSFIKVLRTQRAIVALMEANDNISQVLEQMAREMRTSHSFKETVDGGINFINGYNENVFYHLSDNGTIERSVDFKAYEPITASNIMISNFRVNLFEPGQIKKFPPRITIRLRVSVNNKYIQGVSTDIQTTVSARLTET